jgi:hypothetical protein
VGRAHSTITEAKGGIVTLHEDFAITGHFGDGFGRHEMSGRNVLPRSSRMTVFGGVDMP